ncbi:MAG: (2Fe-2S)-binding protein, partial [Mesorhizobium sp.]
MIVCSCNVLSDQHVRSAVEAERTRSISQVYGCLGGSVQC